MASRIFYKSLALTKANKVRGFFHAVQAHDDYDTFPKKTVIVISVKHSIAWIASHIDYGHSKEIGTKIGIGNLKQEIR